MNVQEMHDAFRVLGQQMGLQLIRGILPESVDIYLNDAIVEKTQKELAESVTNALAESANTIVSTMTPINAFRTLYRSARYAISTDEGHVGGGYKVGYFNKDNGYYVINIPTVESNVVLDEGERRIRPMMFHGFSVEYGSTARGNAVGCRMIGADVLEATLRDYCNGASKEYPIVCLTSVPASDGFGNEITGISGNEQIELYTNVRAGDGNGGNDVKFLNVKYIKVPNVVKYDDDPAKCVNCDLPDYIHYTIVEMAVGKFFASVGAQSPNVRAQQRN